MGTLHEMVSMRADWDSGDSKYHPRLELGDTSPASVVDIRFALPGWVENIHSLWFGENGTDGIYGAGDGAMITAYKTAGAVTDLVFFDPQNIAGLTLSDLVSGAAGLWETSGTRSSLIIDQPIDLSEELNMGNAGLNNVGTISMVGVGSWIDMGTNGTIINLITPTLDYDAATKKYVDDNIEPSLWQTSGTRTSLITNQPIDLSNELDMNNQNIIAVDNLTMNDNNSIINMSVGRIDDLNRIDSAATGGLYIYDSAGVLSSRFGTTLSCLIASKQIDMNGQLIDNASQIHAETTSGVGIYDSSATPVWKCTLGSSTYALQCTNGGIDLGHEDIDNVKDIKGNQSAAANVDFYGANNAGNALINYMGWDSSAEIFKVNKPLAMGGINKITGLTAGTEAGDSLRYEQLVGVYLPLGGGTMSGNINMNAKDITGLDDLTMNGSGSIVDMNYGSIADCNNLTMYDANVDSPILAMVTSNTESGTGMWMYVAAGKNLKIYENFGDTLLAQLDYDGDLSLNGGLSVGSAKITGLAAATANGNAVRYEEFKAIPGTNATSFIIDQDNGGAGVSSSLRFNRGSTDGDAAIWWDETQDEFQFDSDVAVTIGSIRINEVRFDGSDKITQNSSTGDMEFTVAAGDSFVFKTV